MRRCTGKSFSTDVVAEKAIEKLKLTSPTERTVEVFITLLRKTYYDRVKGLQKKRDDADAELKKLYAVRQALIEKNLTGVYSDQMFKEQNKQIEDQIMETLTIKDSKVIESYNLEAITKFVIDKFTDLSKTYLNSTLAQKRLLLFSIFPSGMVWGKYGMLNTKISPFYRLILDVEAINAPFGVDDGT
jgi:uncharacterized membrane protein YheB (UPF0754 family)